ncbi:hypothetical protein TrST_g4249 [Triparma strigata]|uniref:Hcy-binding domain-containing protein n=1 Tax=Triparma strigata TaxID=1606541 RepID=A0A9W7EUZ0_9STRA|nr:hypothetical protein TrST_g4249 [Triparma strigata]
MDPTSGICHIIDGGLSTQLESQGVDLKSHPKLWTAGLLSSPSGRSQILLAHQNFVKAGADIILTSSYQASASLSNSALKQSVDLALSCKGAQVYLSLGPYGATLADGSEYTGIYPPTTTASSLKTFHLTRLTSLLSSEPSIKGLAFETIPSAFELNVILDILNEEPFKNYPAWITFSSPDGLRTCSGELFSDLLLDSILPNFSKATEPRYVGLNCVHPSCVIPFLDVVLKDYDEKVLKGVVVYPNNGGVWNSERRCWEDSDSVVGFCDEAVVWRDRIWEKGGEAFIGGCCSTDERTIRALKEKLK